jgi:excisionase family DNA binding protein
MTARQAAARQSEESYTVAQVAAMKNVSQGFVRQAIHATEGAVLRAKKLGKGYRIDASAVDAWWKDLPDA